jgi:hypothetical protein
MTTAAPTFDPARLEAFAGRMFGAANGALELRELAAEAGFASFEIAPVDHPMVRFYELMA